MKKTKLISVTLFICLFIVISWPVFADTVIPTQTISKNTTWTLAGSPYYVQGTIWVYSTTTAILTIEPGVKLQFGSSVNMYIGGSNANQAGGLIANGTLANPIIFTSIDTTTPEPGDWGAIYFRSSSLPSQCLLNNCLIEYAGAANETGIYLSGASPTISRCTIRFTSGNGIYGLTDSYPSIVSTNFSSCSTYPISLTADGIKGISKCTFNNNGKQGIDVRGGTVQTSCTWPNQTIPYVITADTFIYNSGSTTVLTLAPGVIMKFGDGTHISVGGSSNNWGGLFAQGTAGGWINFTSLKDDGIGGDTNGDGSATSPAAGDWQAIYMTPQCTATTNFNRCQFAYGGAGYNGIFYVDSSNPTIDNCSIRNSSSNGVYSNGSKFPRITRNIFTSIGGYPITMPANGIANTSQNTCVSALYYGIEVRGDSVIDSGFWANQSIPFVLSGNVYVSLAGGTSILVLDTGSILKFTNGASLHVGSANSGQYGGLIAKGIAGGVIYFTSVKDDIGGDSNGDGSASSPFKGDWNYIYFDTNLVSSTLMYLCNIQYGGSASSLGMIQVDGSAPTISRCTISSSSTFGIYGLAANHPSVSTCYFTQCENYPISLQANGLGGIFGCTFSPTNKKYAIEGRGDNVNLSARWRNMNIPYVISGNIYVSNAAGTTYLDIDQGNIIKFDTSSRMRIGSSNTGQYGALQAKGNPGYIYFTSLKDDIGGDSNGDGSATSPIPGDWDCIYFDVNCLDTTQLDRCVIRYGGNSDNGELSVYGSRPTFSNCSIMSSISNGVYGTGSGFPTISFCQFTGNQNYPISLQANGIKNITNCGFASNHYQGIEVNTDSVVESGTWTHQGVPFVVTGTVYVSKTAGSSILILAPNVCLKFESAGRLYIGSPNSGQYGGLVALGGAMDTPIYFTSIYDDSIYGDTNADGGATSPAPGNWAGIIFTHNLVADNALLDHCVIQYAGNITNNYRAIYTDYASPVIQYCLIDKSFQEGIHISNGSPVIHRNTISNNSTYGILMEGSSVPAVLENNNVVNSQVGLELDTNVSGSFKYNNITNNSVLGAQNSRSYTNWTAERNWWGDTSGPYDGSTIGLYNPNGKGDKVSDYIDYYPWRWDNPEKADRIPDVKMLKNASVMNVFNLNNYVIDTAPSWGWTNGGSVNQLDVDIGDNNVVDYWPSKSVDYLGSDTAIYTVNWYSWTTSVVKYSSYLWKKLPEVMLNNGQAIANGSFDLQNYILKDPATPYPPSYPVFVGYDKGADTGKLNVAFNGSIIQISASSALTGPAQVYVMATTNSSIDDWDMEIIRVYETMSPNGAFNAASDTTNWAFENISGSSGKPVISYLNSYAGASGILKVNFNSSSQAVKMTLGIPNWKISSNDLWYTVRMRVMSDTPNNGFIPSFYVYNGVVPSPTDLAANIIISVPTTWTWMETSLYADMTASLYPQLILKNGSNTGSLYIDSISLIPSKPGIEKTYGNRKMFNPKGDWEESSDSTGWVFEPLSGYTKPNIYVESGRLRINCDGANAKGMKMTQSLSPGFTDTTTVSKGKSAGMRMRIETTGSLSNTLLMAAVYGIDSSHSPQFKEFAGTASIFRIPSTGFLEAAYIANQPYIYGQLQFKNSSAGDFIVDDTYLQTDMDSDNYWDSSLYIF